MITSDYSMNKKIRVLYVEDEPSIAKLLSSGLGLFGIEVDPIFMSAEELLDHIGDTKFADANILMFDIRLPRMTGVELAEELRKSGEERPFVLVSAWPSPAQEKLRRIKAVFLPKPFDFPDVVHTIQKLA
jgi:DNA-binding NtrC family response regulator